MFPYRLSSCVAVLLLLPVAVGAKLGEGVLHEMAGPEGVLSLAYSPDGKRLAAQTSNGICIWDTTTGREVSRIAVGGWSAVFSPDGKTVYAPLQDLSVGAWDVATSRLVKQFKGHTAPCGRRPFRRTANGWLPAERTAPSAFGIPRRARNSFS